jgi:hypothetical protein
MGAAFARLCTIFYGIHVLALDEFPDTPLPLLDKLDRILREVKAKETGKLPNRLALLPLSHCCLSASRIVAPVTAAFLIAAPPTAASLTAASLASVTADSPTAAWLTAACVTAASLPPSLVPLSLTHVVFRKRSPAASTIWWDLAHCQWRPASRDSATTRWRQYVAWV